MIGVDLGTTFSAAAVFRDGRAEIASLGTRGAAIPSVVVLHAQGDVLIGEAAEHRAVSDPTRTAREFKRRLGDPVPIVLGGTPYGAEALMGHLLRYMVDRVVEQEGAPPAKTIVTHPANYGPYKLDLLREAVRLADVGPVEFLTEPEAAAIEYAQRERLEPGQVVAVYDFGGGTFDAAVLRKTAAGFELLGTPEGMERVGGIDFDQAVLAHVDASLGGLVAETDATEPVALAALARLRDDCRVAKEALSTDTDAAIPVMLPHVQTEVRLTRPEFEAMIAPRVAETIASLERAIRSAAVDAGQVNKVLLVGGTSRIPLVAQMVRESTGLAVAVDAHPKFVIALGAATAAGASLEPVAAPQHQPEPAPPPVPPPDREPERPVSAELVAGGRRSPVVPLIVGGIALVLAAVVALVALSGDGNESDRAEPSGEPAAPPTTPAGAAPVSLEDDFADAVSGWPVQTSGDVTTRYENGEYTVVLGRQGLLQRLVWAHDGAPLSDVAVEVTERRRSEESSFAGLLCRSDSGGGVGYAAVVNRRGGWAIMQTAAKADDLRTLAEGEDAPSTARPAGRRLRLECAGGEAGTPATLRLSVDGQLVGEAMDDTALPPGRVGLVAIGQSGAALTFDDFRATPRHSIGGG